MKSIHLLKEAQVADKCIHMGLVLSVAALLLPQNASAATTVVNLGSAGNFAILAASKISDVQISPGLGSSTIVRGDVGLSPASGSFIGLTTSQLLNGTIFSVDAAGPAGSVINPGLLTTAQNDLTAAYNDAAGRSADMAFGVVDNQLGSKILLPGVYSFGGAATANLIGNLTLDGNGEVNPVWIFQASSTLVTASGSSVTLINGANSCNVFWQVSSSATIGTSTTFVGNIMADQSIALQTNATLNGSALARIAAVTLDYNTITKSDCTTGGGGGGGGGGTSVPDGGSTLLLLGSGLATMFGFKRRLFSAA